MALAHTRWLLLGIVLLLLLGMGYISTPQEQPAIVGVRRALLAADSSASSTAPTPKPVYHYRLTIGLLVAPRDPPTLPVFVAKRMSEIVNHDEVLLLAQQSFDSSKNVEQRRQLEELGFRVSAVESEHAQIRPNEAKQTRERVIWRTKELLDYTNFIDVILKSEKTSEYVLIVQDDAYAADDFANRLLAAAETNKEWSYVGLYTKMNHYHANQTLDSLAKGGKGYNYCGCVAILFRREHLASFAAYARNDIFEEPIDWSLFSYFDKEFEKQLSPHVYFPSLFQHLGHVSTFTDEFRDKSAIKAPTFVLKTEILLDQIKSEPNGYIGCKRISVDGYRFVNSIPLNITLPVTCSVACRAYRFYAISGSSCSCSNDLRSAAAVSEDLCPFRQNAKRAVEDQYGAVYNTGLEFRKFPNGTIAFDIEKTTENRRALQATFIKGNSLIEARVALFMENLDSWTAEIVEEEIPPNCDRDKLRAKTKVGTFCRKERVMFRNSGRT